MSDIVIDTSGLSCPQPVVMVLEEIEKGTEKFEIILDNECSCENVSRLVEKYGFEKETTQKDTLNIFKITKKRK
ncbi:MAG: hypothetical protein HF962_06625 [Sulfurovum sp.]|nr:hypothetical protein [Sulfurovum sp.]